MSSALCCVICHDCNPALRFFHVPSNVERLQLWCDVLDLDINSSSIVCEKHFLKEHISRNKELNCCRLNKKAIPTLHLTDEDGDYIKLINEDDFDQKDDIELQDRNYKTKGTQTRGFSNSEMPVAINCLWCKDTFIEPDLYAILAHLKSKHQFEIESFLYFNDDDDLPPKSSFVDVIEETQDLPGFDKIEDSSDIDEEDKETQSTNGSTTMQSEPCEYQDDEDDEDWTYNIEECSVKNEIVVKSNLIDDEEGNIDEILPISTVHIVNEPGNKMLQIGEISENRINMETSDPTLIFFIIDLIKSTPTIWFINCYKSKEYEAGFKDFCTQFSKNYEYYMTENELHESLVEMREWYITVFEEKTFSKLSYPQSEYYEQLAEFLPDKADGKTCDLCGELFNDHIQYFGHKNLEHGTPLDDDDVNVKLAVKYLKTNSAMYYYSRYPLYHAKFSYDCQVCPAKYSTKKGFFEHIKKHLDIRDHVCDVCGKTFVKKSLFIIHQNRHRGTHKFPCKICGREFTNGSLLTSHRKRVHLPIEGTIEEIERRFSGKRTVERASGIHDVLTIDDQIVYACKLCAKTYKYRAGVFKHCKFFHPELILQRHKKRKNKKVKAEIEEILYDIE